MALKKCRECGHKVSSSAKVCPSCGIKQPYISPFKGLFFLAVIGWATWSVFLKDDKSDTGQKSSSANELGLQTAVPVDLPAADTTPFVPPLVCRAAIAAMFGRDINTLKVGRGEPLGVFKIFYQRPSDSKLYSYDCKLSGNYVIWTESGQASNRWNGSGYVDFNVKYGIEDNVLVITEVYGNDRNSVYRFGKNKK